MRIAIFSDTFPPEVNGVANFVYLSAKSLAEKGHEVQVFTVSKVRKRRLNEKIGKFVFKINKVPSIPALVYPSIRVGIPAGTLLPRLIKFRPDIIHTHTPFTMGWEAIIGAKFLRVPLLGAHHTFFDHYLKHVKVDYEVMRKITWKYTLGYYNRCNLVTVPSRALAQEMKEHGLERPIKVLPYFIDTNFFSPPETPLKKRDESISLIYVGRLSYEKSIDILIKSFYLIQKKYPGTNLTLVGDGPERKKLEKLVKSKKLTKKIFFTGVLRSKKLLSALRDSDIFVNASKTETFCIAILEAMAVGLPIVAVGERGPVEFVSNNINGFLVEADNPKAIAEKTIELIENKNLRDQFGKASRSLAQKYSKAQGLIKIEKIYQKLIKK